MKFNLDEEWLRRKAEEEDGAAVSVGSCAIPPEGWCCTRRVGHEGPCAAVEKQSHDYPPVWDETLKAWVNNPPYPRPGQGAKI